MRLPLTTTQRQTRTCGHQKSTEPSKSRLTQMFEANSDRLASRYAATDEQAARKYFAYKSIDPFPDIPSALLNSADISDYVATTGLIFPFEEDDDNLKSAALRVRMLGDIVYWGSDGEKRSCVLNEGEEFRLAANSITYVTLEPYFRIPDYIKVWFHLDASHVYKGLYLNASFIDPGFVGRLSLPLHNPTANEYVLRARDSLIWVTFMKISPLPQWGQHDLFAKVRRGRFREFPERKKRRLSRKGGWAPWQCPKCRSCDLANGS